MTPPGPAAQLLDPLVLQARIQQQLPAKHRLHGVILDLRPGRSVNYWIDERETFVDPYTGRILREIWLDHDEHRRSYSYTVESTLDIDVRLSGTTVVFGADDGQQRKFAANTGQHARGTVDSWLIALHFGAVRPLGVAYRAFVSVLGLGVVLLSVTGVWIWLRKRRLVD